MNLPIFTALYNNLKSKRKNKCFVEQYDIKEKNICSKVIRYEYWEEFDGDNCSLENAYQLYEKNHVCQTLKKNKAITYYEHEFDSEKEANKNLELLYYV